MKTGFTGERILVIPASMVERMAHDPLLSSLHITDIGYYPQARHHYCKRETSIGQYVLIYCVNGKGYYTLNGRTWTINPGQFFILPPGTAHEYGADEKEPWTIYWIHFRGTLSAEYCRNIIGPQTIEHSNISRIHNRIDLFDEIFNSLESGLLIDNIRFSCSLFHYFLGSLCFIRQYRNAARRPDQDFVGIVTHCLEENIDKHLSLKEIAISCGLSESRLSALFHERTGHSVLNYFNIMKIRKACDLLDHSNLKLNHICFKVGISDPYYFSRLFTKIMGQSPTKYRQRQRS